MLCITGIDVTKIESFVAMKICIKEKFIFKLWFSSWKEIVNAITHQPRLICFLSSKQTYFYIFNHFINLLDSFNLAIWTFTYYCRCLFPNFWNGYYLYVWKIKMSLLETSKYGWNIKHNLDTFPYWATILLYI